MLNVMLKEGNGVVNIEGNLGEISADIALMIRFIYDKMNDNGEDELSNGFKIFVQKILPDIAFRNIDELNDMMHKAEKEHDEASKKLGDDLEELKNLEELKKMFKELKEIFK